MNGFNWFRRLLKSERGNVLVIGAATMPLMIGAGAVSLDVIQLGLWKRQLQRAADSGAIAGGRALVQSKDATAAVTRDLQLHKDVPVLGTPTIELPPTSGTFAGDMRAVRVTLRSKQDLPFWSFFTGDSPTVEVSATSRIVVNGPFCMHATEKTNTTGVSIGGNANLNLKCGISTNATGGTAIDAFGSSTVTASHIIAMGGLDTSNSKFAGSVLMPYSSEQENPYANLPDPSDKVAGKDCSQPAVPVNGTLSPGCFSSMNLDTAVTLSPGTYYIKNGDANFGSKARITGTEVTIVFTGDGDNIGKFDMSGQAELTLKAPKMTSGADYPGLVFVRDDDRLTVDTLKINGGQELKIEGGIYFPRTELWMNGNSDMSSQCLQIVAQRLVFRGGANITNDCSAGYGETFTANYVRLVE